MRFTVELRYQSGSSTIVETDAESAEGALDEVRDPARPLIGIRVTSPGDEQLRTPEEPRRAQAPQKHRSPALHRPSRRHP
jgi:hypothetical protein